MIELAKVKSQLSKAGYRSTVWQKAEVRELCNVLHEDERIIQATNGYYEGGFSLLVATDQRLLLVDRKPMFLTLDSISYFMIQEISFNYRLLNSTIHIYTTNKCLDFSSWNHSQIRGILNYAQTAMKQSRPSPMSQPQYVEQPQPVSDPQPQQYMDYESLSVPEIALNSIPYMPAPNAPHINDNTQSAYVSNSEPATTSTLPVEPTNLSTDFGLSAYKISGLTGRRFAKRYY